MPHAHVRSQIKYWQPQFHVALSIYIYVYSYLSLYIYVYQNENIHGLITLYTHTLFERKWLYFLVFICRRTFARLFILILVACGCDFNHTFILYKTVSREIMDGLSFEIGNCFWIFAFCFHGVYYNIILYYVLLYVLFLCFIFCFYFYFYFVFRSNNSSRVI